MCGTNTNMRYVRDTGCLRRVFRSTWEDTPRAGRSVSNPPSIWRPAPQEMLRRAHANMVVVGTGGPSSSLLHCTVQQAVYVLQADHLLRACLLNACCAELVYKLSTFYKLTTSYKPASLFYRKVPVNIPNEP